ncbi:hypothetical protein SISSUDRAFT_1058576 [Sistotremastrum suecicum HHB10207 ss-3]|uniref:SWIM-type domain-containing protein n=1 Tax=Sistotremastrum suecicum HHB10207 ss-3 TaxID=1314776 RepID=A0A166H9X6_9AGAM|nr:hypothetical protein SISSUDRAFT_1058576 [Sistotremastrum suecicum HHB10207 ss-3]
MEPAVYQLLNTALATHPGKELDDEHVQTLRAFVSDNVLLAAFDIVDKSFVNKLNLPGGRSMFEVQGATSAYIVTLGIESLSPCPASCTCPSFIHLTFSTGPTVMCKHILAVLIGQSMSRLTEKGLDLDELCALLKDHL